MGMEVRTWRREQVFSSKRRTRTHHLASAYCFGCGAPWWIKKVTIVDCSGPPTFFFQLPRHQFSQGGIQETSKNYLGPNPPNSSS